MSKLITTQYSATCLTCEERIQQGEEVNWEQGVGVWHKDCKPPRNLARYTKDKEERERLAPAFGHAPVRST